MAEIERDEMEVDVLFVGAGPANLVASYHLMNLLQKHNEEIEKGARQGEPFELDELMIVLIEKGAAVGDHAFSGAVMDPRGLREAMPDFIERGCPVEAAVGEEGLYFLTENKAIKSPILPPPFQNHGNYVVSLSKVARWLGEQCEEAGVQIFPGFPGYKVLFDEDDKVIGVQTGDKGVDAYGRPKDNFEPGIELKSKLTIFGEGPRGNLMKQLCERLNLADGKSPMTYEVGVKEVFEVPAGRIAPGTVYHSSGYPLPHHTFGGSFIYGLQDDKVAVGFVVDLHSPDPYLDPHRALQEFKKHSFVQEIIKDGKVVEYGGKAISIGGWNSQPKLYADGALAVGCTASMLNAQRLKGIHTAMKSGILAAETAYEAMVADSYSDEFLSRYKTKVDESWIKEELYPVRNFHSAFDFGLVPGLVVAGIQQVVPSFTHPYPTEEDHLRTKDRQMMYNDFTEPEELEAKIPKDPQLFPDKLTDAYLSGTKHEEHQPSHLRLSDPNQCFTCYERYRSPCTRFCPVKVYEMPEDVVDQVQAKLRGPGGIGVTSDDPKYGHYQHTMPHPVVLRGEDEEVTEFEAPTVPGQQHESQLLHINFTNCIHCKTCDIKCPYLNLEWTPPEGEGGPSYNLS